jgi:hypothetical protein
MKIAMLMFAQQVLLEVLKQRLARQSGDGHVLFCVADSAHVTCSAVKFVVTPQHDLMAVDSYDLLVKIDRQRSM